MPDIPLEETDEIRVATAAHGLELVLLTTPTTPQERMKRIAQSSQGFVYLVSLTGARRCVAQRGGEEGEPREQVWPAALHRITSTRSCTLCSSAPAPAFAPPAAQV